MGMNLIQLQDNLKNLSDQQLTQAMQMPSQDTPPFLVVSELNRRKKMRDSFQSQQSDQNKTTVAQDIVAAAGVPQEAASQMAQSIAPQTDMTNNTGIMSLPQSGMNQQAPVGSEQEAPAQGMARGGRVIKMAEGGGSPTATPYIPTPPSVLTDPILVTMANREGMSVNDYLLSMAPEDRDLVVSQSAARTKRDRYTALEPSLDSVSMVGAANPSYQEQTTSVFPPDPEPVRNRPDFEDYGREGAPSYQERGYAAQLPSLNDMLTPNFEETGREPEPGFFTDERMRRATAPTLDEIFAQDAQARADATNAVRPEYIPNNSDNLQTLLSDLPNMDQSQANSEELAYAVQNDRAGPQTGLPDTSPQYGPQAVSRSGLPITGGGYDPLSSPGTTVDTFFSALGGATSEEMVKRAAKYAADQSAATAKSAILNTIPSEVDPREANAIAAKAAADKLAADKAAIQAVRGAGNSNSGNGGGGGGGGTPSKPSSYEQALIDALADAEKKSKQDKWMALAQMGLSMMTSQQPNFLAAVGEAGANAIPAFQKARDTATNEKLALSKGLYDISMQRQARNDALAAASAKQATSGGISTDGMRLVTATKDAVDLAANNLKLFNMQPGQDPTDPSLGLSPDQQLAAKAASDEYISKYNQWAALVSALNSGIASVDNSQPADPTAVVEVADQE